MMNRSICSAFILALVLFATGTVYAESLWSSDDTKAAYEDKKAYKVGDIVTVIVDESATSNVSATTNISKTSTITAKKGTGALLKNIPETSYDGENTVSANGTTTRSNKVSYTIAAKITSIDEHNNLKIEGKHLIQSNSEKEEITITGTVRPQDIGTDNTVASTQISDAVIKHSGSGSISSRQKDGLITRIFKWLF
ncbi:MAG: flagellar basal body L-ring protein FlgH [Armatimonadota bacterium]|nr:flagellar basal body L-ring protein FlgH [bacterium]